MDWYGGEKMSRDPTYFCYITGSEMRTIPLIDDDTTISTPQTPTQICTVFLYHIVSARDTNDTTFLNLSRLQTSKTEDALKLSPLLPLMTVSGRLYTRRHIRWSGASALKAQVGHGRDIRFSCTKLICPLQKT